MAIGKNKRLTKCVAASGVDSEGLQPKRDIAKASRAAARSADRPPPRRRRQQRQLGERRRAAGGDARPARHRRARRADLVRGAARPPEARASAAVA